jgi:hypothetical protein
MRDAQVIRLSPRTVSFTAVCEECAERAASVGWSGSSFAGRLDLDLRHGTFLCRRGHSIRVEREADAPPAAGATHAAA